MPLLPHQIEPHKHLLEVHKTHTASLDCSDTGTGKTYVAVQMAKDLGLRPLIICPKGVISSWKRVCAELGVEPLDVLNPEKIKTGKTQWVKKASRKGFTWVIPDREHTIILFDEVHQYGAPDSLNSLLLASTKTLGCRVHCMSATLAETPLRLRGPGYIFNLHNWYDFYDWAARHACYRNPWNGFDFSRGEKGQEALKDIHSKLFPEYGVRMSIKDIPDFPETLIQPESYDLDRINEVREIYQAMEEEIAGQDHPNPLVALLRARQQTELIKCPLVYDMIKEQLEEGHSIVVFCNFKDTLRRLKDYCTDDGTAVSEIHGDQTGDQRDWNIQQFQDNHRHVCLAIIQAGGIGVSLHDLKGRPRMSIIFPPLTARDLKQALGRIQRAGALSPTVQKIVFAAGTVEEDVCRMVRSKIKNLDLLNDGHLTNGIL
jgi:superfamily II DNA or RNA helicase